MGRQHGHPSNAHPAIIAHPSKSATCTSRDLCIPYASATTTTRRLLTLTANACGPAFETFVGLAYEDSSLDIYQLFPTEDTWEQLDDRLISCLTYDPANAELTGTLQGAAR